MRRTLFDDGDLEVAAARYAPASAQAAHVDERSRITALMAGSLVEDTAGGAALLEPGALLYKSNDVSHEDRVSPDGAATVSLVFAREDGFTPGPGTWRARRTPGGLRAFAALMDAALAKRPNGVHAAAADLLAAVDEGAGRRKPPRWLARLKDDLECAGLSSVDVAGAARSAGCHPAHASRLFRAAYGLSITDHGQVHAMRRAHERLARGDSLSDVAQGAGFYDQSHMNRVFVRISGATPAAWRRFARAAAG
ncbi:MAG: helix-turn-helix transcriptional regulator [Caulobacteraceae bacterium]|nr:helix-turn-helix transcriptional regulator [Caulobacteraceae bacterium]